ncbi:MAG: hypothetical protein H0U32_03825 [Thermoleophilaceae bacterium]|nr:hypothetical protein [Thermoleophilaceae bacterium]
MKAGGLLAVALAALAVFAVPAGAGHPQGSRAAFSLMEGSQASVFSTAVAADPALQGTGENMEIVANVPLAPGATLNGPQTVPGGANDASFATNASDIELAGDYAYVGSPSQGMVVINIASCNDPKEPAKCKPFVQGVYKCSGGQFDVQLSPDANIAIVAHESASSRKACHPGEEGVAIIDISDKSNPREVAFISDTKADAGDVDDGAHNVTLDFPNLYVDQYTQTYPKTEVFSLAPQAASPDASPSNPKRIGRIDFTAHGTSGPHDSYPSHRPDGKNLLYAASIQKSDVVNIDDPTKPQVVQTIFDPQVGISHGAEPNFDRSLLIVSDEYGGGTGVGACGGQQGDATGATPLVPGQAGSAGVGAVHFYRLEKGSGLVGGGGTDKAGVFNITLQPNEPDQVAADAGCTSHVFYQAPDQNRMTIAWYGRGTRVVDFSDPAKPRQIGSFVPAGGNTWSAKPHRGFIFTGDIVRGMDVLRYTGEGWPSSSGSADIQRGVVQRSGEGTGKGASAQVPVGKRLVISRRTRRTRGRVAPVVVACKQVSTCQGIVRLRAKFRQSRGGAFQRVRIGQKRFSVAAGKRQTLRVKVNRRARRLLRNRRKVRVVVGARLRQQAFTSSGTDTVRASYRLLSLRRARR